MSTVLMCARRGSVTRIFVLRQCFLIFVCLTTDYGVWLYDARGLCNSCVDSPWDDYVALDIIAQGVGISEGGWDMVVAPGKIHCTFFV